MTDANKADDVPMMTDDSTKLFAIYYTHMRSNPKKTARKSADMPGHECLLLQEIWSNLPMRNSITARSMHPWSTTRITLLPLHEPNEIAMMPMKQYDR
jgi:hypothetical protein